MIIGKKQYSEYLSNFLELNSNDELALENFNLKIEEDESHIVNNTKIASVVFLDIYDFSNKIKILNLNSPNEIVSYLRKYYNIVFYYIDKYGGRVDRVIGDGIIAVFSDIFINRNSPCRDIFKDAYYCCKEIIKELSYFENGKYQSKAAIGSGNLYFCKISSNNYHEITCIGEPLTIVYRLENEADKNQILLLEDIPDISNNSNALWKSKVSIKKELKGLGQKEINVVELK